MRINIKSIFILMLLGAGVVIGFSKYQKKSNLDNYYASELEMYCKAEIDPKTQKWGEIRLIETEAHMLQDGYNRAEIKQMMFKAYDKAYQFRYRLEKLKKNPDISSMQ